jgi:hypothetical protein
MMTTMSDDIAQEVERVRFIFEDWFRPPPQPEVKKRPRSRRRKQDCMDCGVDTSFATGNGHYYMVHREIWLAAVPGSRGEALFRVPGGAARASAEGG